MAKPPLSDNKHELNASMQEVFDLFVKMQSADFFTDIFELQQQLRDVLSEITISKEEAIALHNAIEQNWQKIAIASGDEFSYFISTNIKDEIKSSGNDFNKIITNWYSKLAKAKRYERIYDATSKTIHAFQEMLKIKTKDEFDWWQWKFEVNHGEHNKKLFEVIEKLIGERGDLKRQEESAEKKQKLNETTDMLVSILESIGYSKAREDVDKIEVNNVKSVLADGEIYQNLKAKHDELNAILGDLDSLELEGKSISEKDKGIISENIKDFKEKINDEMGKLKDLMVDDGLRAWHISPSREQEFNAFQKVVEFINENENRVQELEEQINEAADQARLEAEKSKQQKIDSLTSQLVTNWNALSESQDFASGDKGYLEEVLPDKGDLAKNLLSTLEELKKEFKEEEGEKVSKAITHILGQAGITANAKQQVKLEQISGTENKQKTITLTLDGKGTPTTFDELVTLAKDVHIPAKLAARAESAAQEVIKAFNDPENVQDYEGNHYDHIRNIFANTAFPTMANQHLRDIVLNEFAKLPLPRSITQDIDKFYDYSMQKILAAKL